MAILAAGAGRADQIADVQLRERLAQLDHCRRHLAVSELANAVVHEINQPLGAIVASTETFEVLLQSSPPDLSELREIAADIRRDSLRAADVVRHLRGFLKRPSLELREVDLAEPVQDAIRFFSALAVNANINSSLAQVPLPVKGNVVQLHQAIMSLVANAMDAMSDLPCEQREVLIATQRMNDFAKVSVFDRGPGVPSDKLKEIFAPFFSTKERIGLGLSVARTIIEAHDGKIWAENLPAGGAVFCVKLPLVTRPG